MTNSPDITPFRTLGPLRNDIDVGSYGPEIESMEDIMINKPLVDAFYGQQTCMFCDLKLFVTEASAVLHHFLKSHKGLMDAFSPALAVSYRTSYTPASTSVITTSTIARRWDSCLCSTRQTYTSDHSTHTCCTCF